MKKVFANAVMMIMLLTGCSYTAENFTADYPISGKGAILKFSAADENKITVQTIRSFTAVSVWEDRSAFFLQDFFALRKQ